MTTFSGVKAMCKSMNETRVRSVCGITLIGEPEILGEKRNQCLTGLLVKRSEFNRLMHVRAPNINQMSTKLEGSSGRSREQESSIVLSSAKGFRHFSNTGEHTPNILILKVLCNKYML